MWNRESDACDLSVDTPDSGEQTLQRLLSGGIPQAELVSSIEAIFSSRRVIDMVGLLQGNDAQVFIDAVDEVCNNSSVLKIDV